MAEQPGLSGSPPPLRNPYPGLRPFRTDEEHLFFGRERQIDRLVDKLAANRFLAVVGTSGSGKSSLVNCGLRPALHAGHMASAGAAWRMAQFSPGSDPIGALAAALAEPGVLFDAASLAEMAAGSLPAPKLIDLTLRLGSLGLVDMVEQARLPAGTQLLLVADQFEELFRFRSAGPAQGDARSPPAYGPSADATAFVQLLLQAAAQTEVAIHVVLTMRSDYLGDCAQFHQLPEAINEGQYLVPRLTRDEIRSAITGPALLAQAEVSPLLLTRLLNDVGDNPDQLSILQHALNRSFAHWENDCGAVGPLALANYEAIGGMQAALDRHAEKAYAELAEPGAPLAGGRPAAPSARQRLAEQVLRALTDKGTDARGIRRPTPLADLCSITGASPAELAAVMAVFRKASRSFLMPAEGKPLWPQTRIDISHESLMRVWRRLDQWADTEAAAARQLRRLADSADLHRQLYGPDSETPAGLLTDRELALAQEWQQRNSPNAAWAAQYGGRYALVDSFIARSRKVRLAHRVDAEIDLLWQTRGRLVLIALTGALFMVLQIAMAGPLDGWMLANSGQFLVEHPKLARALVQLMTHLTVGVPALLIYDFSEPRLRLWRAARIRPAVTAHLVAAAEAAADARPPLQPLASGPPEGLAVSLAASASASASADIDAAAALEQAPAAGPGLAPAGQPGPVFDSSALARANDPAQRAGPLRRLAAAVIDFAVFMAMLIMFVGFSPIAPPAPSGDGRGPMTLEEFVIVCLLAGVVSAWGLRSPRQATLGKRLLGLIVVDRQGQRLGFWRAYLRHIGKCLSWTLGGLGWVPLLMGKPIRRALPDVVAGTRVLLRPHPPAPPT